MVEVVQGDLFESGAQTLVNTVNTVGVMGKGIALEFRRRFPEMFEDYRKRCERGEVQLGRPFLFRTTQGPWVVNFPTKEHWRSVSRLDAIEAGLIYLERHYREWGITSLAVPPLGCGNGQLEWRVVGPVLYRHLRQLDIPVKLYAPADIVVEQRALPFLSESLESSPPLATTKNVPQLDAPWIGIAAIVERVSRQRYRAPIGRVMFQKMAYFAGTAGIPIDVTFRRGSFGPFAPDLKRILTRLANNGILREQQQGRALVVEPGSTYPRAAQVWATDLENWDGAIERVVDLFLRLRSTRQAEIAATVHFASKELDGSLGRAPSEREVFEAVREWKARHANPPRDDEIADAIRSLNVLGWLNVPMSDDLPHVDDEELLYA